MPRNRRRNIDIQFFRDFVEHGMCRMEASETDIELDQGGQVGFLTPNLTNSTFFEAFGVKFFLFLIFGFFPSDFNN